MRRRDEEEEKIDAPVVVAIDPGGITGWAVLQIHPEALVAPDAKILDNVEHWAHGQIHSPAQDSAEYACVDELVEIVRQFPGCCVLMEDFILRMFSAGRELLAPVRLNSVLGYALRVQLGIQVTHRQQPSEAKNSVSDERLKSWGFYEREGGLEHARDADRHALLWMRKAKDPNLGSVRRALWWPHLYGPGAPYYVARKPPVAVGGLTPVLGSTAANPGKLAAAKVEFKAPVPRRGRPKRKRGA